MSAEPPVDPLSSAAEHVDLGLAGPGGSLPKRVVERLTRFFLEPQRAYNRGVIDAIRLLRDDKEQLGHRIALQGDEIHRLTAGIRSDLTRVQMGLADGQTDAALTRGQVVELARMVQDLETRLAQVDAALADRVED